MHQSENTSQYVTAWQIDLNKKLDPKQNTIQAFNIDAQGFRKTRNENPPMRKQD